MKRRGQTTCPGQPPAAHTTPPPPAGAGTGACLAAPGHRLWARRRRALIATALAWLAFALAGGLVQYAPQGWTIPVGQWAAAPGDDLYWTYPWTPRWAVVVIPAFLGKALPVALLFGAVTAMAAQPGSHGRRAARGSLAGAGLAAGVVGMLARVIAIVSCGRGRAGGVARHPDGEDRYGRAVNAAGSPRRHRVRGWASLRDERAGGGAASWPSVGGRALPRLASMARSSQEPGLAAVGAGHEPDGIGEVAAGGGMPAGISVPCSLG